MKDIKKVIIYDAKLYHIDNQIAGFQNVIMIIWINLTGFYG